MNLKTSKYTEHYYKQFNKQHIYLVVNKKSITSLNSIKFYINSLLIFKR